MTDYATHCAWCHAELHGRFIESLPAFSYQDRGLGLDEGELAIRYCSARCVSAMRAERFGRPRHPGEKWVRFVAEVPPELAHALDHAQRRALGVNRGSVTRSNLVRAALRMYLDAMDPVRDAAFEGTVEEGQAELVSGAPYA